MLVNNLESVNQSNNIISIQPLENDPKKLKQVAALEEELKRSKNYIEHLERKVKLIMEENKILKSLLLENKKNT